MRRLISCLLIFVMVLVACGTAKKKTAVDERPKTTVRVDNRNWLDMTIYVLKGEQRVRLGQVTGLSAQTFTIPDFVLGALTVRFLADPVGGRGNPVSQEIAIQPGDHIELTIQP